MKYWWIPKVVVITNLVNPLDTGFVLIGTLNKGRRLFQVDIAFYLQEPELWYWKFE
jgi:hypothetical protein